MGNQQCCEAENREYQETYPQLEPPSKIHSVKIQPTQSQKKESTQEQKVQQPKIEVVVQQEPITIPQLNPKVQAVLQDHQNHHQQAQIDKQIKKFGNQVYVGQLDKNTHIPHGYGKIYKTDGSIYAGLWVHGKAQGKGLYVQNNGAFYQGQFHSNHAHGTGKYSSPELIYEGGFKANKFEGQGVQKGNNFSFQGEYRQGNKRKGLLSWQAGKQKYEYNGEFNHHNQFQGVGKLKEPSGVYQGEFKSGQKHGNGEYKYENGLKYAGEYRNGKKCGKGTLRNFNHSIAYEGEFEDDLPHGEGYIYDSEGVKNKRKWVKGIDIQAL